MNVLKVLGQTTPPDIDFEEVGGFDWAGLLTIFTDAISTVAMPALPFLIGAAALGGAFTWISRRGKSAVKIK